MLRALNTWVENRLIRPKALKGKHLKTILEINKINETSVVT